MLWQDVVFTIGSAIFTIGLIPQLKDCLNGACVNQYTAALTTMVLGIYCMTYVSLGLFVAAIPHTALMWGLICVISYRNRKKNPECGMLSCEV